MSSSTIDCACSDSVPLTKLVYPLISAMMKKPERIFDGADNDKDLKKEDKLFSVVGAKKERRIILLTKL